MAQGLYNPAPVAISANGNSGPIAVPSGIEFIWLALETGTPTGTTPTLTLHVDGIDAFGNILADIVTLPAGFALTTVAGAAQVSFGPGEASNLNITLPPSIQLRWVVTGTTPNYPNVQFTVLGR